MNEIVSPIRKDRLETYVEYKDTPEDPLDCLGDVPPRTLSLGSGTREGKNRGMRMSHECFSAGPWPRGRT
jgi:hypothetical protein